MEPYLFLYCKPYILTFTHTLIMEEFLTEEEQEVKRTFGIYAGLFEKMEQVAYWERTTQKHILNEALAQYFATKDIKPIPSNYKKPRRGRKPA